MKWVTRARPKVDRIACPWLIKRFVDQDAEFLYVPADQVNAVALRERHPYTIVIGIRACGTLNFSFVPSFLMPSPLK